jgi:predicted transcriptional regulator
MTRDELIKIIKANVTINTHDFDCVYLEGVDDAADAIMAKLELEQKIAISGEAIELLALLQRENDELLAENRKLRKELAELQDRCKLPNLGEFFDWDAILKGQEQ